MSQKRVLDEAVEKLIYGYKNKIEGFGIDDFLKTGVDPFRFTVNVSIWGLKESIRKEIEHKVEMALENLIGDFHENYLGNVTHSPSQTKWKKIQEGAIPGIDIVNENLKVYLQIKSKHNSMNSSSAKRLAQELKEVSNQNPNVTVGCSWVVATQQRKAIGENIVAEVAACYKGNKSYKVVTGEENELDNVLAELLNIIPEKIKAINFEELLDSAALRVANSLEEMAKASGKTAINIVTEKSIN